MPRLFKVNDECAFVVDKIASLRVDKDYKNEYFVRVELLGGNTMNLMATSHLQATEIYKFVCKEIESL